jgi:hypothetical protein
MNDYDRLLEWASERGEGTWRQWRDACEYLNVEPNQASRGLSALGHVEFDWTDNRFSCAPASAVLTLHSSGCVVVTGARPRGLRGRLEELYADEDATYDVDLREPVPQARGPETWLVEAAMEDVAAFCEAAELKFELDSGRRIASALPVATLETVAYAERPDGRFPRKRFDPRLRTLRPESTDAADGLWWVEEFRRDVAFIRHAVEWYRVPTREYGPYLAYPDTSFISYSAKLEFMTVDNEAPLPPLVARALTLQSGRLPLAEGATRHTYVNIDDELAELVQEKLATPIDRRA